jgi:hypothetical protein
MLTRLAILYGQSANYPKLPMLSSKKLYISEHKPRPQHGQEHQLTQQEKKAILLLV